MAQIVYPYLKCIEQEAFNALKFNFKEILEYLKTLPVNLCHCPTVKFRRFLSPPTHLISDRISNTGKKCFIVYFSVALIKTPWPGWMVATQIPVLRRQRQVWVQVHPGLQSRLQGNQGWTQKPYLGKRKKINMTNTAPRRKDLFGLKVPAGLRVHDGRKWQTVQQEWKPRAHLLSHKKLRQPTGSGTRLWNLKALPQLHTLAPQGHTS